MIYYFNVVFFNVLNATRLSDLSKSFNRFYYTVTRRLWHSGFRTGLIIIGSQVTFPLRLWLCIEQEPLFLIIFLKGSPASQGEMQESLN